MDELSLSPLRGVFENKKAHLLEQMLNELAENEKADEDTGEILLPHKNHKFTSFSVLIKVYCNFSIAFQISVTWELPSEERSSSRQRVHQKSRKRKRNPHDSPGRDYCRVY